MPSVILRHWLRADKSYLLNITKGSLKKNRTPNEPFLGYAWWHWRMFCGIYVAENIVWFQVGNLRWDISNITSEWHKGSFLSSFKVYASGILVFRAYYRTLGTRFIDFMDITYDGIDELNEDFFRYCHSVIQTKDTSASWESVIEASTYSSHFINRILGIK